MDLFAPLDQVHLPLVRDTKQVLEHVPARTSLEPVLVEIGRIIAILTLQGSSSLSQRSLKRAVEEGGERGLEASIIRE